MTLGPGKYDAQLKKALRRCGATSGVLFVCDGANGNGFSCQASLGYLVGLPEALEMIAKAIRADLAKIPRDA